MPEQKYANIGMNDVVSIKPTGVGSQKIAEKADHQNQRLMEYPLVTDRVTPPQPDSDGYIKGPCWYLMQMFNWLECVNGCDVFFSDMRIIVPPDPRRGSAVSDNGKHPEGLSELIAMAKCPAKFLSNPSTIVNVKRAQYAVGEIRRLRAKANRLIRVHNEQDAAGNHIGEHYAADEDLILEEEI